MPQPAFPFQQHQQCEVCDANIPLLEAQRNKDRDLNICGSMECLNLLKQKERLPEASFQLHLKSYRKVLKQRQQRSEQRQQIDKEEIEENKLIFKSVCQDWNETEIKPEHFVVIPTGRDQLIPLPEKRIQKYSDHLDEVIQEALEYESVEQVPEDNNQEAYKKLVKREALYEEQPFIRNISDQFCMLCKGGCCSNGSETAYLSASSIRRLLDEKPELAPFQLKDIYLSYLGESSMKNACINQGPRGCVLPRELRSSTCNQFYCSPINKLQDKIKDGNHIDSVIAIQRQDGLWDKSHFSGRNPITHLAIVTESKFETITLPSELTPIPE